MRVVDAHDSDGSGGASKRSLSHYDRFKSRMLPVTGKRSILFRILAKAIFEPRTVLANINKTHVRKLVYYVRTGSLSALPEKLIRRLSEPAPHQRQRLGNVSHCKGLRFDGLQPLEFPVYAKVKVSIVIPVLNNWMLTYQCFRSILENTGDTAYQIIVVDDGSRDETVSMLAMMTGVKVLTNDSNRGFVHSCNRGARTANGEYVLFLNNDTIVTRGWLESMVSLADSDNSVGIVGAKLLYANNSLQEAGGIVWNNSACQAANYGRGDNPNKWEYNYVKEVDYCSAACLLVRREVLEKLNFFDTRYAPGYYEDTDLAFRARELGYRVVYQPAAEIVHLEGATAGVQPAAGMKRYQVANQNKFRGLWKIRLAEQADGERDAFVARDRSVGRRILLFVDQYVPTWDKDAGSFITMEYLKILLSLGYKVVFWPDNLLKSEPYTTGLQQMGVEVVYGAVSFRSYMKKFGKYFDVAFISRPHIAIDYIDCILECSKAKVVYIPHDLNFLRERRRADMENNTKMLAEVEKWKSKELYVMEKSDLTVVFSEREKEIVEEIDPEIAISVGPWVQPIEPPKKGFVERNDLLFLGGFAHLPNEDGVCWFVRSVFPLIKKRLPAVRLLVVGSYPTIKILSLQSEDVIVTGYVQDVSPFFHEAKVFVAPLRYGAGLKGKIIHAMSYGLPVVTTEIGAEGIGMEDGKTGLIATDSLEFAEKVIKAYTSEKLWNGLSDRSVRYVAEHFSAPAATDYFSAMLKGIAAAAQAQ